MIKNNINIKIYFYFFIKTITTNELKFFTKKIEKNNFKILIDKFYFYIIITFTTTIFYLKKFCKKKSIIFYFLFNLDIKKKYKNNEKLGKSVDVDQRGPYLLDRHV